MLGGGKDILLKLRLNDEFSGTLQKYTSGVSGAAANTEKATSRMTAGWQKFGSYLGTFISVYAGQRVLGWMVDEAMKGEIAINKLTQALKTHGIYTQNLLADMVRFSEQLQVLTGVADDSTQVFMALMVSYGATAEEAKSAAKAATDMAAVTGQGMESLAMVLGRATGGETSMLKRYGILVDEAKLKSEGFAAVLDAVNKQFGGQGAAALNTYAGQLAKFKNDLGDIGEEFGKAFLPLMKEILPLVLAWAKGWAGVFQGIAALQDFPEALRAVGEAFKGFWMWNEETSAALREWGMNAVNSFVQGFEDAWNAVKDRVGGMMPDWLKKYLEQHSPAEMGPLDSYMWGAQVSMRFADGIEGTAHLAGNAADAMVTGIATQVNNALASIGSQAIGMGGNIISGALMGRGVTGGDIFGNVMSLGSSYASMMGNPLLGAGLGAIGGIGGAAYGRLGKGGRMGANAGMALGILGGPLGMIGGGILGGILGGGFESKSEGQEWREKFRDLFKAAGMDEGAMSINAYEKSWDELSQTMAGTADLYRDWAAALGDFDYAYVDQGAKMIADTFTDLNLSLGEQADLMGSVIAKTQGLTQAEGDLLAVKLAVRNASGLTSEQMQELWTVGSGAYGLMERRRTVESKFEEDFERWLKANDPAERAKHEEELKKDSAEMLAIQQAELEEQRQMEEVMKEAGLTPEDINKLKDPAQATADNTYEMLQIMKGGGGGIEGHSGLYPSYHGGKFGIHRAVLRDDEMVVPPEQMAVARDLMGYVGGSGGGQTVIVVNGVVGNSRDVVREINRALATQIRRGEGPLSRGVAA